MSNEMIGLIFSMLFLVIAVILFYSLWILKHKLCPPQPRPRPRLNKRWKNGEQPSSPFSRKVARIKETIYGSVQTMEDAPSIESLIKQREEQKSLRALNQKEVKSQIKKDDLIASKGSDMFSKLKASRTKRKQLPSSGATPAIKSLRDRKV